LDDRSVLCLLLEVHCEGIDDSTKAMLALRSTPTSSAEQERIIRLPKQMAESDVSLNIII